MSELRTRADDLLDAAVVSASSGTPTPEEVLEIDRQNLLRLAESGGSSAARLGYPRTWNIYPDNGLYEEFREAWLRGYDAEEKAA